MTMVFTASPRGKSAELCSGDRLTREEFHALYKDAPADFRAELIGGTVYAASPLKLKHGTAHPWLSAILFAYQVATPGVELGDNATILLGDDSEPQPDLFLRILPEQGGLSSNTDDGYVQGAIELAVEIAHSSKAIDLHQKRLDYKNHGIPEYLVYVVDEQRLRWFDLRGDREISADATGIFNIVQFPGLWIDCGALVDKDHPRLISTLQAGLASPEHSEFVQRLARSKQ